MQASCSYASPSGGCRSWQRPAAAPACRAQRPARGPQPCRAERKEFYDYKDMPPVPLAVSRIYVPELDHLVVDRACEQRRMASLAIFYDIWSDDQYARRLTRKSAITALCMYDRDDVDEAQRSPGTFPNIDLLHRVYNQGLDLPFTVEELGPGPGGAGAAAAAAGGAAAAGPGTAGAGGQ